jgi:hypothetical protein
MRQGLEAGGSRADALGWHRSARRLPGLAFGALLVGLCAWRLWCVQRGPDPDTDAYGHYVIARLALDTPLNFKIHWVWLPLYHALLAIPVWLGATLDHVRSANALAALLPPVLLLGFLRRRPRGSGRGWLDAGVPLLAALLTAQNPLLVQLGTTGQMEVFFCVLLVLAAGLLSEQRWGAASLVLSALVLTRYEGWAVVAVVAAIGAGRRVSGRAALGAGALACVLLPAACVLGWAALRRLGGEPWFGFILDNQAFAEQVLERQPDTYGALGGLGRYTVSVPYRVFGICAAFALLGVRRTLREDGVWFVAPGLAVVAFLTLSSLLHSQLGLDRHFLSVVPFAALWMAHGVAGASRAIARAVPARGAWLSGAAPVLLCAAVVTDAGLRLDASLATWSETTRTALLQPREVARFLRGTPAASLIVCDDAAVEVLSELPRERFVRTRPDERSAALAEWSRSRDVYLVGRARNLGAFSSAGPVSYGTLDGSPDAWIAIAVRAGSPARAGLDE